MQRGKPRPLSRLAWLLLRAGRADHGKALGVLNIWQLVERLDSRQAKIRTLGPDSLLRYSLSHHRAAPTLLADGTRIETGDPIVELHIDNRHVTKEAAASTRPWETLRRVRGDVAHLRQLALAGDLGDFRALHGVTLLAAAGRRADFEVRALPDTFHWRLERFFQVGLTALYHPRGWPGAQAHARHWPGEVWMSRSRLLGSAEVTEAPDPRPPCGGSNGTWTEDGGRPTIDLEV